MSTYQKKWKIILSAAFFVLLLIDINKHAEAKSGDPYRLIVGLELPFISYSDNNTSGSPTNFGYTLAISFLSLFEVGYAVNKDRGNGLFDSKKASATLLYARANLPLSEKITGFVLVGNSKTEVKVNPVCFFSCGNITNYRHQESGAAWGAGLQWQIEPDVFWSLKYIDYSNGSLDFTGIHFGFRVQFDPKK